MAFNELTVESFPLKLVVEHSCDFESGCFDQMEVYVEDPERIFRAEDIMEIERFIYKKFCNSKRYKEINDNYREERIAQLEALESQAEDRLIDDYRDKLYNG